MAIADRARFWVIFDTCTKKKYYEDVHNLLAAPAHAFLTYDYSKQHLSPPAANAAASPKSTPPNVLLVYTQHKNYKKGDELPADATPNELIWIPTRLGIMRNIRSEGDRYYFDFTVAGYPKPEQDQLMQILNPLIAQREVPLIGGKWVAISDEAGAFEELQTGSAADGWQGIVDTIGNSPSIFQGDSFWRIKAVCGAQVKTDESRIAYVLREGQDFFVEITSHTPRGLPQTHDETRSINVHVQNGPLEIVGDQFIGLRRHTKTTVNLRSLLYEDMKDKDGQLRFETIAYEEAKWPEGPNLVLDFSIRKRWLQIGLGILFALASATAVFIANNIAELYPREAIGLFILGCLLGVASAAFLFRRFVGKLF